VLIQYESPPQWGSTVKNHQLWRIMDVSFVGRLRKYVGPFEKTEFTYKNLYFQQETIVNMIGFIRLIDASIADRIESPSTPPKNDQDELERIWVILGEELDEGKEMGNIGLAVKKFLESDRFVLKDYNDSIGKDEGQWTKKKAWGELTKAEKCNVGVLGWKKGAVKIN
jgi:hypothetical protein